MYEKKINLFSNIDREVLNKVFKYNTCFLIILLIIIIMILFLKKENYYQNYISFVNGKNALLIVDKDYLNYLNQEKKIVLNDITFNYNIDKIEEKENNYVVSIHFINDISLKTNFYKIILDKESLLAYLIRTIKGE